MIPIRITSCNRCYRLGRCRFLYGDNLLRLYGGNGAGNCADFHKLSNMHDKNC